MESTLYNKQRVLIILKQIETAINQLKDWNKGVTSSDTVIAFIICSSFCFVSKDNANIRNMQLLWEKSFFAPLGVPLCLSTPQGRGAPSAIFVCQ